MSRAEVDLATAQLELARLALWDIFNAAHVALVQEAALDSPERSQEVLRSVRERARRALLRDAVASRIVRQEQVLELERLGPVELNELLHSPHLARTHAR